ncbi:hypothetical protein ACB092_08G005200 [Castanea dentata]
MGFLTEHQLSLIFGLLGIMMPLVSLLSHRPTFYKICKKKSSEGFQSIPYVISLLSAMLLLYYGFLKTNGYLIITINGIGCVIEVIYLTLYIIYAPKKEKVIVQQLFLFTVRLVISNIGAFGLIMVTTIFLLKGSKRVNAIGWICAVYNLAVFAAPLSIMMRVIRTKSVEFMPFTLSLFLTLCATVWFFYGYFVRDFFIALPNVMGFLFGISQMILYIIYKDAANKDVEANMKQQESNAEIKNFK